MIDAQKLQEVGAVVIVIRGIMIDVEKANRPESFSFDWLAAEEAWA